MTRRSLGRGSEPEPSQLVAAEKAQTNVLFDRHHRLRSLEPVDERGRDARIPPVRHCAQTLRPVVERVRNNKCRFVADLEEALPDRVFHRRIDGRNGAHPLEHVKRPDHFTFDCNPRLRTDRLCIHHQAALGERRVDVAQSVHDALDGYASQRPAAEGDVEPFARDCEYFGRMAAEPDPGALLGRQRCLSRTQILLTRVEGIDGRASRRCEAGQAAVATADIKNTFTGEHDELVDRGPLDASLVTAMHL